jgi:hypothetical protein
MERTRRFLADFRHDLPFVISDHPGFAHVSGLVDRVVAGMNLGCEISPGERARN